MGTFTWTVPSTPTPAPSPGAGSSSITADALARTFGLFDQEIDPEERDYIDGPGGVWSEIKDSRTAVMLQLEIEFGKWWVDPDAGSRIAEMLRSPEPPDAASLALEVRRALGVLVSEGIIADLVVDIASDEFGAVELHLCYTDLASGASVDGSYLPFGG